QAAPQAPRVPVLRLAVPRPPEAGREELARLPATARLPGAGTRLDGPGAGHHGLRGRAARGDPRGRPVQLVAEQRTGRNPQPGLAPGLPAAHPRHAPLRARRQAAAPAALLPARATHRGLRLAADRLSPRTA